MKKYYYIAKYSILRLLYRIRRSITFARMSWGNPRLLLPETMEQRTARQVALGDFVVLNNASKLGIKERDVEHIHQRRAEDYKYL